jgi:hypothetical protein
VVGATPTDVRVRVLRRALDDWISDYEVLGEFQGGGVPPAEAYAAMVGQIVDWIRRGVLVPGQMLDRGFATWPGPGGANARRFAELAGRRSLLTQPGQICWFDTGPAVRGELEWLSTGGRDGSGRRS